MRSLCLHTFHWYSTLISRVLVTLWGWSVAFPGKRTGEGVSTDKMSHLILAASFPALKTLQTQTHDQILTSPQEWFPSQGIRLIPPFPSFYHWLLSSLHQTWYEHILLSFYEQSPSYWFARSPTPIHAFTLSTQQRSRIKSITQMSQAKVTVQQPNSALGTFANLYGHVIFQLPSCSTFIRLGYVLPARHHVQEP